MSVTLDHRESASSDRVIRTCSFLSLDGDNTYGWDANDDQWVIPMIQKKMDEGYSFWIIRRGPTREVKLRTADEAKLTREIIIKDGDARILFEQGRIGIVSQPVSQRNEEFVRERTARTAEEAAANDTIAHRPARGG
jgi:hypothetical protein